MRFGRFRVAQLGALAVVLGAGAAACGSDAGSPAVIAVPGDHATIQEAVDAARPGDLVLIDPGTYRETVVVDEDDITIRGRDRNAVILDGGDELSDGIVVSSDGVAVENLTVRRYRQNGVLFNGSLRERTEETDVYGAGDATLVGYRIAYVTAANNGLYGVYAFASRDGLIDHVYTSGSPDSGIYIGQCKPCNAVVTDSIAELNAIGYYGTNASGSVYVIDSVFRRNRLGIAPNSQEMELLAPQVETVVAGNLVVDNDDPAAPAIPQGFFGGGIAVGGGTKNLVLRNRVTGHDGYGIGLVPLNEFDPISNRVEGNVLSGNAIDLLYQTQPRDISTHDNCFVGNEFESSLPVDIESVLACDREPGPLEAEPFTPLQAPPPVDHRDIPLPPDQPTMPGDVEAIPTSPATAPTPPDLTTITVPPAP